MERHQWNDSFNYGLLICPANETFCLKVTEDFSKGQLKHPREDKDVSAKHYDDTFQWHFLIMLTKANRLDTTRSFYRLNTNAAKCRWKRTRPRGSWHPVQLLQHPRILPCFHFNVQPVWMLLFQVTTGFLHQSTNAANYSGQPYEHSENNTENVETGKCPKNVPLGLI